MSGDGRLDVRLARGLTLSGTVTVGGEPLAGAQVGATAAALGGQHQSAISDDRGRFTLTGLLPVRYTVSAFRDGYRHRQIEGIDPRHAGELVLDLGAEATATIEGVLHGVSAAPGGRVLHQAVSAQGDAGGGEAVVEPDGAFRIEEVPAGVVRVQAWVETEGGSRHSSPVAVEVAAGEVAWVELDLGAALTVSGRVTVEGEAAAGARLIFNGAEGTSATAVSGADGEYSIGLPRPGAYTVVVHHEPRVRMQYQAVHEIAASRRLDVDVREAWLRGVVLDAESGEPVPEAFVTLLSTGTGAGLQAPVAEAMTDRRGRFALAASTRGPFELLVGAAGYGQGRVEAAGVERDVVVELRPAAGLQVRVVEAGGDVPLQAHLVVRDEVGLTLPARTEVRPNGVQRLSLAAGRYLVTAIVQGYGQRTVAATAPGELTIEVGPAGSVVVGTPPGLSGRLHVVDPAGVEAQPCCHDPGWPLTGSVTAVAGLAAGRYTIELRDAGGEVVASAPVLVEAGGTARLRFD